MRKIAQQRVFTICGAISFLASLYELVTISHFVMAILTDGALMKQMLSSQRRFQVCGFARQKSYFSLLFFNLCIVSSTTFLSNIVVSLLLQLSVVRKFVCLL